MSDNEGKIACRICGALHHSISHHLAEAHPTIDIEHYQVTYPDAPILSEFIKAKLAEKKAAAAAAPIQVNMATAASAPAPKLVPVASAPSKGGTMKAVKKALHEVFELGDNKAAMNSTRGTPIPINVLEPHEFQDMVPPIDKNYVFAVELLKDQLMAFEMNLPLYAYGHAGTGKTTLIEQICARTNRPLIRVQHTANTEESHVIGQWTLKAGSTQFEFGPLALAMKHGWVYLADEYDFALPSVLSVYQPIMERNSAGVGKSLMIKEADAANRMIVPHPMFRIVATGNTNGSGDDTGLYQGTQVQNAANYDRFNICTKVDYMPEDLERKIVSQQAGVADEDAEKFVEFGQMVRKAYDAGQISNTVSPRTLIVSASLGKRRNSGLVGVSLAFINKLSKVDKEAVDQIAQRIFGDA